MLKLPQTKRLKQLLVIVFVVGLFGPALWAAQGLTTNESLRETVASFGYLGVLLTGIVSGLNTIVPVPGATFSPLFTAAGLTIPLIIFFLALGTLIADFISYLLGRASRELLSERYPKIVTYFTRLRTNHKRLLFPMVTLYAAFVPFPNEAILIPLAFTGIRFVHLLLPLIIGNILHQALLVYGIAGLTELVGF